ncbi:hypothetical protein GUJ93_ZPchr0006g42592 [Zizania palustris]|uniref:non-specific serine/threonine protein kinase n=1 Tax=Zizania palustris TaxID=103762 RepID=A0A8J5SR08_ZIZPA|nr:hypothetical protein GUJ93_ZPchr0006g42592 [Zizania palustris]KAG8071249.1 hypothetical protein GUJ93_ZPchr0006g42592 [Zizania palustris]
MWRFNPFGGKVQNGLEGRTIDVGNIKITVHNAIAQGGFSCVYLACDEYPQRTPYYPNVVTLVAHDIFDMGRTKEALLVMEFCEKSLVSAMESRGSGYYEEQKALLIFRDICNAVFAMHGQSPPIAHRDLKAENVLLGLNGEWKICDFGSTSTNHKCFDKPEEMGIEEDIIRKHTTPAYRPPEMWDLYRREVISEKVDIWALGCLLQPKYSTAVTRLIKDMLDASPNERPDITQVWFRVNELLPLELQKNLSNGASSPISMSLQDEDAYKRTQVMPKRSPPPPPREQSNNSSLSHGNSKAGDAPLGAFWATQHAQGSQVAENRSPLFDEEPIKPSPSSKHNQSRVDISNSAPVDRHGRSGQAVRSTPSNSVSNNWLASGANTDLFMQSSLKTKASQPQTKPKSEKDPFNSFVAEFEANNLHSGTTATGKESELEAEVSNLKEQLKKTSLEKAEMTAKYEKLSAICRSQHQEIQEPKRTLTETTPPPSNKVSSRIPESGSLRKEKIEGTVWELEQGMFASSSSLPSSEAKTWQAFPEPKAQPAQARSKDQTSSGSASAAAQINRATITQGSSSERFSAGAAKKVEQPSGCEFANERGWCDSCLAQGVKIGYFQHVHSWSSRTWTLLVSVVCRYLVNKYVI